jgi:hypothetical protein
MLSPVGLAVGWPNFWPTQESFALSDILAFRMSLLLTLGRENVASWLD